MSISDPLLKELKGAFVKLINNDPITDSDPYLVIFCETLESIFEQGLVLRGDTYPPVYGWMNAVAFEMDRGDLPRVFPYIRSIDYCRGCEKVKTSSGQFRLLVRCCLLYKCLHVPVEAMVRQVGGKRHKWYQPNSILGHEVLGEILLSVLMQGSQLNFQLDINNARLLDFGWAPAELYTTTLVPCSSLGLTMSIIKNLAVIVRVDPGSVSAEDGKIEAGDILDVVNDHVITENDQGRLKSVLTRLKNQPITLQIVKTNYSIPHKTHPALIKLIRGCPRLAIDLGEAASGENRNKMKEEARSHIGYQVKYLGSHTVGNRGDITMVEGGIRSVTASKAEPKPVTIECRELDVMVSSGNQILMRHPFMSIASCGHSALFPRHFAYLVGNTGDCTSASEFVCHVFVAETDEISAAVLLSLGYGFQRTQCAV